MPNKHQTAHTTSNPNKHQPPDTESPPTNQPTIRITGEHKSIEHTNCTTTPVTTKDSQSTISSGQGRRKRKLRKQNNQPYQNRTIQTQGDRATTRATDHHRKGGNGG
ncbi:hypothetical protein TSUD_269560 [Trifolium subterraneum]|uniref:Uncharacterized protein n=1 Tax=Trifolium subterraneum TaxID=3900 RepID=A0A2Z6N2L4_TRISU|nr:hypothetical protein TSUD_269560 [Trifolium subterraneum]